MTPEQEHYESTQEYQRLNRSLKAENDKLTQLLCGICKTLMLDTFPPTVKLMLYRSVNGLKEFQEEHERQDALRLEREQHLADQAKARAIALAKLSPADKEVLGL